MLTASGTVLRSITAIVGRYEWPLIAYIRSTSNTAESEVDDLDEDMIDNAIHTSYRRDMKIIQDDLELYLRHDSCVDSVHKCTPNEEGS